MFRDEVAITGLWGESTDVQFFRIVPEIRDQSIVTPFDATVDSTRIHFRLEEMAAYVKVHIQGINRTIQMLP